jgi:hypothetical protein
LTSPLLYLHHQRTTQRRQSQALSSASASVCSSALCAVSLFARLLTVPHRMNTERTTAACVSKFGTFNGSFLFLFWWVIACGIAFAFIVAHHMYTQLTQSNRNCAPIGRTARLTVATSQRSVASVSLVCGVAHAIATFILRVDVQHR